jgi:hypothetical protein
MKDSEWTIWVDGQVVQTVERYTRKGRDKCVSQDPTRRPGTSFCKRYCGNDLEEDGCSGDYVMA